MEGRRVSHSERVERAWADLEQWFGERLPSVLGNLRGPASDEERSALEAALPILLPPPFVKSLTLHDGETDAWEPGVLPDAMHLLPAAAVLSTWRMHREIFPDVEDDVPDAWRRSIEDGIISVEGPVKPITSSAARIPIALKKRSP
jgi:cell wall assembly regulator SMI1